MTTVQFEKVTPSEIQKGIDKYFFSKIVVFLKLIIFKKNIFSKS